MSGAKGGADRVQAGGITNIINASIIRPNNTDTYNTADVVANSTTAAVILTFDGAATFEAGGGMIQAATLISSLAPATKPEFDLFLFDTTVVMENDADAFAPSDAEMETCIGVIPFLAANFVVGNGNGLTQVRSVGLPYTCKANSTSIYGIVVARNAYVPGALEKFTFRLHVLQD